MCLGSNPDLHGDRTPNNGLGHSMVSPHSNANHVKATLILIQLYLGLSNGVVLTDLPVRNTFSFHLPHRLLYVQQILLRYSRAVRLGFNTVQNSVLQLCWLDTCSRTERVGECAVGSKEPLRIMGNRAV
jgi:hypothetical protein